MRRTRLSIFRGNKHWEIGQDQWSSMDDFNTIDMFSEHELEAGRYKVLLNDDLVWFNLLVLSEGYWHNKTQYIAGSYQLTRIPKELL